jgi:hypothetical protein
MTKVKKTISSIPMAATREQQLLLQIVEAVQNSGGGGGAGDASAANQLLANLLLQGSGGTSEEDTLQKIDTLASVAIPAGAFSITIANSGTTDFTVTDSIGVVTTLAVRESVSWTSKVGNTLKAMSVQVPLATDEATILRTGTGLALLS